MCQRSCSPYSPDCPDISGQQWRHDAIVRKENGGRFSKVTCTQRNLLFTVSHSVHLGLSASKRQEEASVAILEVVIFISLDFACINRRCSYDFCGQILRYVKNKRYFVAFTHFLLNWFYFLLVLVLLKLHRAKFHECKQRRFYVRCLWIWGFTSVDKPLLS